jgi:hypothetical protein
LPTGSSCGAADTLSVAGAGAVACAEAVTAVVLPRVRASATTPVRLKSLRIKTTSKVGD